MTIKNNLIANIFTRVRKGRTLKHPGLRAFLFLFIASLILYFCTQIDVRNRYDLVADHASDLVSVSIPSYESYIQFFSYIVKPGDTFAGILSKFNIPENNAANYYRSLKSVGFTTIFPGDSIVLSKDNNEKLKTCSLLSKLNYWYHLYIMDSTLCVEKKPVEVTKYHCIAKGTLLTSLSEDMFRLGVGDALVFKFADIFAWDINFFIDPRKGDKFEVLFEKNYREGRFIGYGSILAAKYVNGDKTFYAIAMKDKNGKLNYYDIEGKSVQKQFLKAPLRFSRISSGFSYRRKHPILGIYRPHQGVDYAAPRGTPVYSAADGIVRFSGFKGGYGNNIRISHGASYQTYYGHLQRIQRGIKPGAHVKQGQFIGTVGATGLATGPHLDYRMKIGSRFINPLTVSVPSKEGVSPNDIERFESIKQFYLSSLEMRFNQNGCFVLEIIRPQPQKTIISKTTLLPETDNGHTPSS